MEEINISTFKATCLELLKRVKRTGLPVLVTLRGEPVAEVRPPQVNQGRRRWLGSARESGEVKGDLVAPTGERWEAMENDDGLE